MDLRITTVQSVQHWENKKNNLELFTQKIRDIKESTDLIILPEMFSTGFTMNAAPYAEEMSGPTMQWLREQAAAKNCVITASFIVKEGKDLLNRLVWMQPNGSYKHYDKRHLFRMANEHQHYSGGSAPLTVELKGWKIRLIICYDLRFPAWSRQQLKVNNNGKITEACRYDLLVCIANWPERRSYPWRSLATARAIENVAYAVVVNRVGKDGNDIPYSGDSGVINYLGEWISTTKPHEEKAETVTISRQQLDEFRKNFPTHMDADELEIKV